MGAAAGAVWGRAEQQDFRSRVRGTLLGAAVGDALGAPVDALGLDEIREAYGAEGARRSRVRVRRRGAVTHLTQLTLFTVDGLIRAQVRRDTGAWHPPTDLHRAYLRWAATQRDWGPDERRKDDGWLAAGGVAVRPPRPDPVPAARVRRRHHGHAGDAQEPRRARARGRRPVRALRAARRVGAAARRAARRGVRRADPRAPRRLSVGRRVRRDRARAGPRRESRRRRCSGRSRLLAARPGHEPVSDALQHALGAVRQGMPTPARVEELAGRRVGGRGAGRRRVLRAGRARTYGTGCASP